MTYREAIECLGCDFYSMECCTADECRIDEALKMAIKSIEFRIPESVEDYHHCPNCGYGLPAKGITDSYCDCCYEWKYCPYCGQALDWSRKNEIDRCGKAD